MNRRFALAAVTAMCVAALSTHGNGQAQQTGAAGRPTEGPPRRGDGRPDLSGVWMPPYVPDMTVNRRDQRGYAEAPFSPDDTPQARQATVREAATRAELPFTPAGLADWSTLRRGHRRLHRQLFPVRPPTLGERAVSVPDHAGRVVRWPCSSRSTPGTT